MKRLMSKRYISYIPALIHIIFSIVLSRSTFRDIGENISGLIPLNNVISFQAETVLAYILTIITASVIIVMLWKLLFTIINDFKKSYILFGILYIAGLIFVILSFPYNFTSGSADNFITYACAIHLTPDYWHNAYSSIIYGACMMVLPGAMAVSIIQWSFFLYVVAYIYHRVEAICPLRIPKYLVLLIFLLPNTPFIIHDAYRIFQYTILMLLYVSIIVFDLIEKRIRPLNEMITIAVLGAFLSVWRSEGILICLLLFAIYVIFTRKKSINQIVFFGVLFIALFLLMSIPQKAGIKKYYGKDYSIINSMGFLQVLFNCGGNVSYEGAELDLNAIETVTPVELIRGYGIEGYRYYNNVVKGNIDFNQSAITEQQSDAFLSAYKNLLVHNVKFVVKNMIENLYVAYTGKPLFFNYVPERSVDIPDIAPSSWKSGMDLFMSDIGYISLDRSDTPLILYLYLLRSRIILFLMNSKILLSIFALILIGNMVIFLRGLIFLLRKKDSSLFSIGLVALSLLIEYIALSALVPAATFLYFIIYNYASLLLFMVSLINDIRSQKDRCTP